jgi:Nickel responsive protein SCO4226-like
MAVVDTNADSGVTWVHSYVSADKSTTFCVYDGPSPEAIRRVAELNKLPVDRITEVRVLDPYFYR